MARTVSFSQQGVPAWLALGRRWQELTSQMDVEQAATELRLPAAEVRTAKRYARAAQFLAEAYPGHVGDQQPVLAGSVAVLQLARLHQLAPTLADELAPAVLRGELNVAQVRARIADEIERSNRMRQRAKHASSAWLSSFRELAFQRLTHEQLLRAIGWTAKVDFQSRRRSTLEPDFIATFAAPYKEMAISVRGPRDIAAKSQSTVAAQLLAHIATLLLRYDLALLVLPMQAENVADATLERWDQWVKPDPVQSCRMYVILLGEHEHRWLRGGPASHEP